MQAMLTLIGAWDPLTAVDLHVTDGASRYSPRNWLQRDETLPVGGF